jgi:hypothetical protein
MRLAGLVNLLVRRAASMHGLEVQRFRWVQVFGTHREAWLVQGEEAMMESREAPMRTPHLRGLLGTRRAMLRTITLLGAGVVGWPDAWGQRGAGNHAVPLSLAADVGEDAQLRQEIVEAHNRYRAAVQMPPLTWSPTLAQHAQAWAKALASRGGVVQHSPQKAEGENVWVGTAGAFSYTQMVEAWGKEQQFFVSGIFPNVSTTGKWADVGHYTQMVWRQTREVGAAIAHGGSNTVLVCRYSPRGNIVGKPVL